MVAWLTLLLASLAQVAPADALTVSAAVSLTEALEDVGSAYRTAGGGPVSFNIAGSNVLSRQVVSGAPVDVFISADDAQMDVVERAQLLVPGTRTPVVANQLVVIVGTKAPPITSVGGLAAEDFRRIAIGDPAAVPAGVYAKQYLDRAGLWPRLESKIVPTANVRAALAAVQNGSADAAIVYATDAKTVPNLRPAVMISGPESPRIVYPAAVIKTTRRMASATRFVEFLRGPVAQAIFERHGFVPVTGRP
jgi:molybdate transport system substrate-binding protein